MTVNELIEVLKESGDEHFRDMAEVRILDGVGADIFDVERFDLKVGTRNVDIVTDIKTYQLKHYDDDFDYGDDDGCDDEYYGDEEDYDEER